MFVVCAAALVLLICAVFVIGQLDEERTVWIALRIDPDEQTCELDAFALLERDGRGDYRTSDGRVSRLKVEMSLLSTHALGRSLSDPPGPFTKLKVDVKGVGDWAAPTRFGFPPGVITYSDFGIETTGRSEYVGGVPYVEFRVSERSSSGEQDARLRKLPAARVEWAQAEAESGD